jgi:hypothetical protein
MLMNFFDSQGVLHKEFVPEGKTVNAEFCAGVMDRLLKRIHRVCPAAFCSQDFFLLHDNVPAHKAASDIKRAHFVDVAEIREVITDELKKVQKEEFLAAFQKLRPCKSLYIC